MHADPAGKQLLSAALFLNRQDTFCTCKSWAAMVVIYGTRLLMQALSHSCHPVLFFTLRCIYNKIDFAVSDDIIDIRATL